MRNSKSECQDSVLFQLFLWSLAFPSFFPALSTVLSALLPFPFILLPLFTLFFLLPFASSFPFGFPLPFLFYLFPLLQWITEIKRILFDNQINIWLARNVWATGSLETKAPDERIYSKLHVSDDSKSWKSELVCYIPRSQFCNNFKTVKLKTVSLRRFSLIYIYYIYLKNFSEVFAENAT